MLHRLSLFLAATLVYAALPVIPSATFNLKDLPANFHDIHVTNLAVTRSPMAGRILGLPEQVANNATVKWNGARKTGPLGGQPEFFY